MAAGASPDAAASSCGNSVPGRFLSKSVLVTGASTGIGRAVALRFAAEGADVAINYARSREAAEQVLEDARSISGASGRTDTRHMLIQADVGDEIDARRLIEDAVAAWGRLDVLINNAGIQTQAESASHSMADVRRVMNVNLLGALACAQAAISHWRSRETVGVIVNCSSVHERIPKPGYIGYSLSKGGLGNLTRTLALEYADKGIRVNSVAPGAIATPMNRQLRKTQGRRIGLPAASRCVGWAHLRRWQPPSRFSLPTTRPTSPGKRSMRAAALRCSVTL